MNTNNKIALITGGGSGIGRAFAIALLNKGWHLVLAGRREDALKETLTLADKEISHSITVPTDVTKPNEVKNLFDRLNEEFGRIDLLFNNAGHFPPNQSIEDIDYEVWQSALDVNLSSVFLCTKEAFRMMKDQKPMGGRIINNGSISAQVPRPNSIAYTAAKHGINGITKSTSLDGRKYKIACGQIDIGNAATAMTTKMKDGVIQAGGSVDREQTMALKNVTNALMYMAEASLDATILNLTVLATDMPFVGRG